MLHKVLGFADLVVYLTRRLLWDSLGAPKRAAEFRDRLRGLRELELREGRIPVCRLLDLCPRPLRVTTEVGQLRDGNPTLVELFYLGALAQAVGAQSIFEIGTFDGATTLQLALNSPETATIYTLDLPPAAVDQTRNPVLPQERGYILKPISGGRFLGTAVARKIQQLYGDSGTFSYAPYIGRMDLVFIDGSHALEYVRSDSANALALVRPGGWIVWHDYGVWPDVTRGLQELSETLTLVLLDGTSLVIAGASIPARSLPPAGA